jgi:hypothetical protein
MPSGVSTLAYVYAVTWAGAEVPGDRGLELVEYGGLAAVTRAVDTPEPRARRRDLLEHEEVVRQVFERAPVVPLRFGTVVEDVAGELLEPRRDELSRLLRSLEGLVEVTLRAFYREEDILRALLEADPRLARLRTTAAPVQVGEAVARALEARRAADAGAIVAALRRHARDVVLDDPRTELDVVRAAFLAEREALEALDAEAERLARAHAATTVFKYTGPLPPHHFVDLGAG